MLHHQTRLDGGIGEDSLTATPACRHSMRYHLGVTPDRQRPTGPKRFAICRSILEVVELKFASTNDARQAHSNHARALIHLCGKEPFALILTVYVPGNAKLDTAEKQVSGRTDCERLQITSDHVHRRHHDVAGAEQVGGTSPPEAETDGVGEDRATDSSGGGDVEDANAGQGDPRSQPD